MRETPIELTARGQSFTSDLSLIQNLLSHRSLSSIDYSDISISFLISDLCAPVMEMSTLSQSDRVVDEIPSNKGPDLLSITVLRC